MMDALGFPGPDRRRPDHGRHRCDVAGTAVGVRAREARNRRDHAECRRRPHPRRRAGRRAAFSAFSRSARFRGGSASISAISSAPASASTRSPARSASIAAMRTRRTCVIKVPAADIAISGRTGLRAKDYDQQMLVTPHTSATLPIVGALAAGPGRRGGRPRAAGRARQADGQGDRVALPGLRQLGKAADHVDCQGKFARARARTETGRTATEPPPGGLH